MAANGKTDRGGSSECDGGGNVAFKVVMIKTKRRIMKVSMAVGDYRKTNNLKIRTL